MLESSLVSTEDGLELVAQLIDAKTRTYYWAARYPIQNADVVKSAAWLDTIARDVRDALMNQFMPGDGEGAWQDHIVVRRLPEQRFLFRQWTGSYRQTPEAIRELMTLAQRHRLGGASIMGIYPDDPDLVPAEQLTWRIGLLAGDVELPALESETLPSIIAAVAETTVAQSYQQGMARNAWIAREHYAQTGPTRMIYLAGGTGPLDTPVRIIVPVKRRAGPDFLAP